MRLPCICSLALFVCLAFDSFGQSLQLAQNSARNDLDTAIQRLARLRSSIEDDKIPLARKVAELERQAAQKRKELDRKLRLRDNRDASLLQLKNEVMKNENQLDLSLRLLKDYIRSWRQSSPPAERTVWTGQLKKIVESKGPGNDSELSTYLQIASLSSNAILENSGGMLFQGDAIIPPEGSREDGTFLSLGPALFFSGNLGASGFLEKSFGNDQDSSSELTGDSLSQNEPSRLLTSSLENSVSISNAMKSEPGDLVTLPLDPSLGKALIMEGGELSTLEELQKGGIWIYPIIFFAALSLLIAIFKAIQILRISTPRKAPSLTKSHSVRGPFEMLRKTAKSYQGEKYDILDEILYETIIDIQVKLEKALPLIAVTAATAPLLGLLGTVTGMIDVFRQITNFANPENSELARGISEALVTTKFGLVTAIPSLIVHALLSRRLQGLISSMESFSARLVHLKKEQGSENEDKDDDGIGS
jgi:biopolymer transport protein ExbB